VVSLLRLRSRDSVGLLSRLSLDKWLDIIKRKGNLNHGEFTLYCRIANGEGLEEIENNNDLIITIVEANLSYLDFVDF